jgi:hypothetical protein
MLEGIKVWHNKKIAKTIYSHSFLAVGHYCCFDISCSDGNYELQFRYIFIVAQIFWFSSCIADSQNAMLTTLKKKLQIMLSEVLIFGTIKNC